MDKEGKPTAGIRLKVPLELDNLFRLLHRFGTRLRARHGVGTKRHIKFDDFNGSLFTNIKLPGYSSWTRVTPAMAREDLGASLHKENALGIEEEGDKSLEEIGQFDGADDEAYSPDESEIENYNDDDGINIIKDEYSVRLLLTNARSLKPKIDSLKSAFSSLGLNLACITETW